MRIVKNIALVVFVIYWACTLFYVFPNNYMKIKLNSFKENLDVLIFQNWAFFAPPPDYNTRLYFIYTDNNNKSYEFEAMEDLLKLKQKKAPFNTEEEYVDYAITGVTTQLLDQKRDLYEYYSFLYPDSTSTFINDTLMKVINHDYHKNSAYKSMINYSKIIQKKYLPKKDIKACWFKIIGLKIPKFADRYNQKINSECYFISTKF
ncbi:MAG: hypothetical protein U0W65_14515 [Bacteroidia bacterium]|nr:hypothetical protein [Bacteroidia bacterium]